MTGPLTDRPGRANSYYDDHHDDDDRKKKFSVPGGAVAVAQQSMKTVNEPSWCATYFWRVSKPNCEGSVRMSRGHQKHKKGHLEMGSRICRISGEEDEGEENFDKKSGQWNVYCW